MAVTVHIKHLEEPCGTAAEETASVPSLPRLRSVQYTEVEEQQKMGKGWEHQPRE